MNKIPYYIVDIETNGLIHQGAKEILSVAYIKCDRDSFRIIDANVLYFYHENMQPNRAQHINNLDYDFLKQFEEEHEKNVALLANLYQGNILIGHNILRFDSPFIKNYLLMWGYDVLAPFDCIDTYKTFRNKLTVAVDKLGYTEEQISKKTKEVFKGLLEDTRAHSASYDTIETYFLALNMFMKNGGNL